MITEKVATELKGSVRGDVILPNDGRYDDARKVYNAMIDKRPAVVVRCTGVADVIAAVKAARAEGLAVAIRGGGHSVPGFGTADDALVIDLGRMRGIRVDPATKTVRAEGGSTWGDFNHATHAFGLATTGGHHLDDRHRGTHPRRRHRVPHPRGRPVAGQPGLRRRRPGGRLVRHGQPEREPGSLLGVARRRRQLRRGDELPVQASAREEYRRRANVLRGGGRGEGDAHLRRVHLPRTAGTRRLLRMADRAAS